MGTMFNLLPWEVAKGICDAEAGLCLKGECTLWEAVGGLKTRFEVELARGLRFCLETDGIGA